MRAAELEVKDVERRTLAEARSHAVRLLALDLHLALHRQQMELARKLSRFAKERATAGEVSPSMLPKHNWTFSACFWKHARWKRKDSDWPAL